MKSITLKIGQLFDFISSKYKVNFELDTMKEVPFELKIQDENNNWQKVSKLIKKTDELWETIFNKNISLQSAAKHKLAFNDNFIYTENLIPGENIQQLKVLDNKKIEENSEVYGLQIDCPSHLYKTSNGLIHHNTTEIENNAKDYLLPGWELVSESGTIGNSMTAIVPFMYKHSQQKIIILDDINTIFKTNYRDPVLNFMMAILDKKASTTKPVKVDKSQLNRYNKQLEESVEISINKNKLKEGILEIKANKDILFNEHISLQESQELYHLIKPTKEPIEKNKFGYLKEVDNKEFLDDLLDDEEDIESNNFSNDDYDYDDDLSTFDPTQVPERFPFNSRIIMITNVKMTDINQAFRDRCLVFFVELSVDQYIERLNTVLPNILKDDLDISKEILDWAKNYTYKALESSLKAFKHNYNIPYKSKGQSLFATVEINRDLTFRLYEELVQKWIVFASKKLGNNIKNASTREELSKKLLKPFVILYVIPFLKSAA